MCDFFITTDHIGLKQIKYKAISFWSRFLVFYKICKSSVKSLISIDKVDSRHKTKKKTHFKKLKTLKQLTDNVDG